MMRQIYINAKNFAKEFNPQIFYHQIGLLTNLFSVKTGHICIIWPIADSLGKDPTNIGMS